MRRLFEVGTCVLDIDLVRIYLLRRCLMRHCLMRHCLLRRYIVRPEMHHRDVTVVGKFQYSASEPRRRDGRRCTDSHNKRQGIVVMRRDLNAVFASADAVADAVSSTTFIIPTTTTSTTAGIIVTQGQYKPIVTLVQLPQRNRLSNV